MPALRLYALALAAAAMVSASPCPFGQMAESGQLSDSESAHFYAVRSEGDVAVERMIQENSHENMKREHAQQEEFYNEQVEKRKLKFGGGLLKGELQPFTGVLSGIKLPKAIKPGLRLIPDAAHPYKYPKKTAVRGMCPTLNTMANHGYISRDGITSFAQATEACQETLGFGFDTCAFLSALGLLAGGNLETGQYSIGGQDKRVPASVFGPALGASKHGFFEIDGSISRADHFFGNQADYMSKRYDRWAKIAEKNAGLFSFETMAAERRVSYKQSRETNPQFNSDAKATVVALAERVFIPRALANGTEENRPNAANVAPFYKNETFPDEWFRRATPYGLQDVGADIVSLFRMAPTAIGNNEGFGNFVGTNPDVDLASLTPAEAACFAFTNVLDFVPGAFAGKELLALEAASGFIEGAIRPFFGKFKCDAIDYTKSGADAGIKEPGVSTRCNQLVNGHYNCGKPVAIGP